MEKLKYQAPVARDLSGVVVSGRNPLYLCNPIGMVASPEECLSGAQAGGNCSTGLVPGGATNPSCVGGTTPLSGECVIGYTPSVGETCASGDAAGAACSGGGAPG
jgi:hypothetical protein